MVRKQKTEEKAQSVQIEERLKNMQQFYVKAGDLIDHMPAAVPKKVKDTLKSTILGDKDLKKLMEGIESHRPPRLFLIGRTGVGKSSLINALCGSYTACVSDVHSCTKTTQVYECREGDRTLMEICDTRGLAESESLDDAVTAESMLIRQINEFSPDVALFVLSCTHRDDIARDVEFLKKLAKDYADLNSLKLPIVCVVNKCDEMAPARLKDPEAYPENKIAKINEVVQYYKGIIVKNGLRINEIVPVSSLIDWMTPDGTEVDVEDIDNLPENDRENIQIAFDGRWQIDKLFEVMEKVILDSGAQMGLRMASRLKDVVHRLAQHINSIFSTVAATIALTPIPIADIYVLLTLQALLVALIASLSGREVSLDTAKEFILSLGGVAGAGFAFRLIAQQGSKLLNLLFPGAGSAVSAGVAAFGTAAIGKAAIAYYIDGFSLEEAKKLFEKEKEKQKELPEA